MTNFDPLTLISNNSNQLRADRQMADLRNKGWMLELERAFLELGSQHNGVSDDGGNAPEDVTKPDVTSKDASAKETPRQMTASDSDGKVAGQAPQLENADRIAADSIKENRTVAKKMSTTSGQAQSVTPGSQGLTDGKASEAPIQYPDTSAWVAAQSAIVASKNPTYTSPYAFENAPLPEPLAAIDTRLILSLSSSMSEKPALHDASNLSASVVESPTGNADASDTQTVTEEYSRRQFHLYAGEDGVHAWIRDADLTEIGARSIALALVGELNNAGTKLAALTFNGKRVATSSRIDEDHSINEVLDQAMALASVPTRSGQFNNGVTIKGEF